MDESKNVKFSKEQLRAISMTDEFFSTKRMKSMFSIEEIERNFNRGESGSLIAVPTGSSATTISCPLIKRLKVKTVIIADMLPIIVQWTKALKLLMPEIKIGGVHGSHKDYGGDFDVIMIARQSLVVREKKDIIPEDFWKWADLVITDNVRPEDKFSMINGKFKESYNLGIIYFSKPKYNRVTGEGIIDEEIRR